MKDNLPGSGNGPAPEMVWTFLTNHSHVLLCLALNPDERLRDVALKVGITERAVQRIVSDLERAGVLQRARTGRRNHYVINPDRPLRHPVESHRTVGDLLRAIHPDLVLGPTLPETVLLNR